MSIKKSAFPKLSASYFGLLLSLVAVLFFPQNIFSTSWTIEIIDAEDDKNKDLTDFYQRFIAVDDFDLPHIVYGEGHLFYAYYDGIVWQHETVDSSQGVGRYASIAIDSNSKMHISYHDITNSDLKYSTNTSGSWVTTTIDSEGSVGWDTAIAIDSNNKAHISYHDNTNRDLKYATNVSGSWITFTLDSGSSTGFFTAITIDSNNKVHISYFNSLQNDLKYATNASGSWVTSTIDGGFVDGRSSIAIDSKNKVHISYCDRIDYGSYFKYSLNYATDVSGSWMLSTIGNQENVGWYNSIAIDSNDKVHISYYDSIQNDLEYATNISGSWVTSTIDSEGAVGLYNSIAIDSNNKMHISYYDTTNHDLKYATNSWAVNAATVNGTLTLPAEASGKEYVVIVDNDTEGDNGWISATVGTCGSGTTVDYSITNVPAGTYYVYAVVRIVSAHDSPAEYGDHIGFYGSGETPPDNFNAIVPDSGTVTFDIALSIWSDDGPSCTVDIISPSASVAINEGESVNFQGSVNGGDGPFTYHWDFGGVADSSTDMNPGDIVFDTAGIYLVTFSATDVSKVDSLKAFCGIVFISINVHQQSDGGGGGNVCFVDTLRY